MSVKSVVVVGLGNPIRKDDAVGILVVQQVAQLLSGSGITVVELSSSGWELLELLVGYKVGLVVDSVITGKKLPGGLHKQSFMFKSIEPSDIMSKRFPLCEHQVHIRSVLAMGKRLQAPMPFRVELFGVEVENVMEFGEAVSPRVRAAIPRISEQIARRALTWRKILERPLAKQGNWQ